MFDLILLIDDCEADNFFHKMIIQESGCAQKVIAMHSAKEALQYLNTSIDGKYPHPDLIFLDINMPGMNGWEFMQEYETLNEQQRGANLVIMLTTSLNPDDDRKARQNPLIKDFINKPLSIQIMQQLMASYATV